MAIANYILYSNGLLLSYNQPFMSTSFVVMQLRNIEFKFEYRAGNTADVPRGRAHANITTMIIITIHKLAIC